MKYGLPHLHPRKIYEGGGNAEYSPAQEVMKTYVTHVEIANMGTTQGDTAMGCKF